MNMVVHQGALGDWAVTLPMVRALRESQGTGNIGNRTLMVTGWERAKVGAKLIKGVEAVNIERAPFAGMHGQWDEIPVGGHELNRYSEVKLVVSFVSNGSDAWGKNVRRLCPGARYFFVDPRVTDGWDGHVSDWFVAQMEDQGCQLIVNDEVEYGQVCVDRRGGEDQYIVIHPGSGGRAKCWARDRFERLIERLMDEGQQVIPVLGEVEFAQWEQGDIDRWVSRYGAWQLGSLNELYDVLVGAGLYVGNDSGPTHLAAQMGVPTVGLFGPTDPVRWGPRGPKVEIMAPPEPVGMDWLHVDRVLDACGRMRSGAI